MGGLGSGRWFRSRERLTTEDLHQIDIRQMKRQGVLYPNYPGTFSWTEDDSSSESINYEMHRGRLKMKYFVRCDSQQNHYIEEIEFDSTSCHLGGERYWFLCPCCKTRVTTLYRLHNVYRCRHCHNLSYRSQSESELDRLIRKSRKLRSRLGCSERLFIPISIRPKGMHNSTFEWLSREEREATLAALEAIDEKARIFEEMGWLE